VRLEWIIVENNNTIVIPTVTQQKTTEDEIVFFFNIGTAFRITSGVSRGETDLIR
jgi:hypothetical protein